MKPTRLFCGHDAREAIGLCAFIASVQHRASVPVAFVPLGANGMPQGSNAFTFSRFLVPWLCDFAGVALFMDGADMIVLADIAELIGHYDDRFAVQCVQHQTYATRHPIKYVGTTMQCPNLNYPRKNWASVMLMNCAHPAWREITPQTVSDAHGVKLSQFEWMRPHVGELPNEWNRLVDEGHAVEGAKVLHWTAGIPAFDAYRNAPGADLWRAEVARATGADA